MVSKLLLCSTVPAVLLALAFPANGAPVVTEADTQTAINDAITAATSTDSALILLVNDIVADAAFTTAANGATVTLNGGNARAELSAANDGINHSGLTVAAGTTYTFNSMGITGFHRANGGAIVNEGIIKQLLSVTFNKNTAEEAGGAIFNTGTIQSGNATFVENHVDNTSTEANGGAVYNGGSVSSLTGIFLRNYAMSSAGKAAGGAYYNNGTGLTSSLGGAYMNNYAKGETGAMGGAIYSKSGTIAYVQGSFDGNYALSNAGNAYGGAIYNEAGISQIYNATFTNNYAQTNNAGAKAHGGAIASDTDLTIAASNALTKISGNYVIDGNGTRTNEGIYLLDHASTLFLSANRNGTVQIDDNINSVNNYGIVISGDDTSEVQLNGKIANANKLSLSGTKLTLETGSDGSFTNTDFVLTSGTLNLINDTMQNLEIKSLESTADVKLAVDANLSTGASDKITAGSVTAGSKISLDSINILADGMSNIELFAGGIAPEFANLNSFAAFTSDYKYTFASDTPGILKVATQTSTLSGLTAAVADTTETRSYTVGDGSNVSGDLGELKGGNNAALTIEGNNKVLDGETYAGIEISGDQMLRIKNIQKLTNFSSVAGGFASSNGANIEISNVTFENNSAQTSGGALMSGANASLIVRNAIFMNNKVDGTGAVQGGAISNSGAFADIFNSSFLNNYATTSGVGSQAKGGAIYTDTNLSVTASGANSIFSGNYVKNADGTQTANDIYVGDAGATLSLYSGGGGSLQFNSGIDGDAGYKISIDGDDSGTVKLNAKVANAGDVTLKNTNLVLTQEDFLDGSSFYLVSGKLDLSNGSFGTATFNNFSGVNGVLSLDVDPAAGIADKLVINGDLTGTTKLLVNANGVVKPSGDILFAETHNDNEATTGAFEVWRVTGNPYQWQAKYDSALKEWYMNTIENPFDNRPLITPESIAYMGLNSVGLEQTRNLSRNVYGHAFTSRTLNSWCGQSQKNCFNQQQLLNVWANPVYSSAKTESPIKYDANIGGLDAGADIRVSRTTRIGLFGSYRLGKYDFDGQAEKFSSEIGSEINVDSYVGGLYLRHEYLNSWTMASIYGGSLQADIKTNDGIKTETNGSAFGANIETGKAFKPSASFIIEPSVSASYARVAYDKIEDEADKEVDFGSASQVELLAALKFEKIFELYYGTAKIYFKPGVLQTLVYGDDVKITGLDSVSTLENETLARLEAGTSFHLEKNLSAFASVEYTFNDSYKDMAVSLGLSYSF